MNQLPMMTGVAGEAGGDQTVEGQVLARSVAEPGDSPPSGAVQAFTFGDAVPVLDCRDLLGYVECWHNGRWYEPPVNRHGLAKAFDVAPHHASAIRLKVNLLAKHFRPSRWLSREQFRPWALDFLVMGDGYLERRDNLAGRPLQLWHSLARYTRRGVREGTFFFVPGWRQQRAGSIAAEHEFAPGSVFQLRQEHPTQEIYGVPDYLAALQSSFLNEAATLFRRRYYLNGSHAGFIFYAAGAGMSNEDADAVRQAMRDSKGPGNFRNLFLHAPAGKKDDIQIIPISEVAAKDEFMNIKNCTRDDQLAAHRVPPIMIGVIPTNAAGFGKPAEAAEVFHIVEIEPLQARFLELNEWLGLEAVAFNPYQGPAAAAD